MQLAVRAQSTLQLALEATAKPKAWLLGNLRIIPEVAVQIRTILISAGCHLDQYAQYHNQIQA